MDVCRLDHTEALPQELRAAGKKWMIAAIAFRLSLTIGLIVLILVSFFTKGSDRWFGVWMGALVLFSRIGQFVCMRRPIQLMGESIPGWLWQSTAIACIIGAGLIWLSWPTSIAGS